MLTRLKMFAQKDGTAEWASGGWEVFGMREKLKWEATAYRITDYRITDRTSSIVWQNCLPQMSVLISPIANQFLEDFEASMQRAVEAWARGEG